MTVKLEKKKIDFNLFKEEILYESKLNQYSAEDQS